MSVNENNNTTRSMISSSFGDEKANKEKELNASMSIANSSPDAYSNKIKSLGGNSNE